MANQTLLDATERLIESGILDDIYDSGYNEAIGRLTEERNMEADAEQIVRLVLNA